MSVRPVAAASTAGRRPGTAASVLGPPRGISRVPLAAQALPIVAAFVCSYLAYERMAGGRYGLDWSALRGVAGFFVLFLQLRLIDDLDDLERDRSTGRIPRDGLPRRRVSLLAGLGACAVLLVAVNHGGHHASAAAAVATVVAYIAPFGFKRLFPHALATGSLLFEGAPFLIFVYIYCFWRDAGGEPLGSAAVACIAGLFWTGYEFWKFSRKVHSTAMQPYFLGPRGIRTVLNALLVLSACANVAFAILARLSDSYRIFAAALPAAWLFWANLSYPAPAGGRRRPLWAGMTFVGAVEVGLLSELFSITGSH